MSKQKPSSEWREQWSMFQDDEAFLFNDWIKPATVEDFRDQKVLECGCGGGYHTSIIAAHADRVTAVDLNTTDIARERNADNDNVTFIEEDLATMKLGETFDTVICIGVIHHTDDPDETFENLVRHCKPGGRVIVWTYSAEGNALVRFGVEPLRKIFLRRVPRSALVALSRVVTAALYPFVYSIYLAPFLSFLPYFGYFKNFRRLSFERNVLNVFDKLNAPQTRFTTRAKCAEWFTPTRFDTASISIRPYAGVSYTLIGRKLDVL